MTIYRGVGGVNRGIKKQFRGVGGVNREIKKQFRGVGGVNREVFNAGKYLHARGGMQRDIPVTFNRDIAGFHWSKPVEWREVGNGWLVTDIYSVDDYSTIQSTNPIDLTPYSRIEIEVRYNKAPIGNTFLTLSDMPTDIMNKQGTSTLLLNKFTSQHDIQRYEWDISNINANKYVGFFTAKEQGHGSGTFECEVFKFVLY